MASLEFERIRWLTRLTGSASPRGMAGRTILGIGDDAALWQAPRGHGTVLTVDIQVEGVHFRRAWLSPGEMGARAVAASASDLAAMAARPAGVLLSFTLPQGTSEGFFRALYRGALEEARRTGLRILGGNLSSGALQIAVTSVGAVLPRDALRRSGARVGDGIYVTGWPGRSRIGRGILEADGRTRAAVPARARAACRRAFARPKARIREALWIRRRLHPRSMVDISDGLSLDLLHILEQGTGSGTARRRCPGAVLDAERIIGLLQEGRCAAAARRLDLDPLEAALSGGEDYEILFTAPPGAADRSGPAFRRLFAIPLTRIGTVERQGGIRLRQETGGGGRRVAAKGFDHFSQRSDR